MKKSYMSLFLFLMLMLVLSACSSVNKEGIPIKNFSFTDQNGKSFSLKDLKGKVTIVDFIFTSCKTICPPMTYNMSELQKKILDKGYKDVQLVSYSIDPSVDTPKALKTYGLKFTNNLSDWHFLTGYSQNKIENFAKDNFKEIVVKPDNDDQVIHGTSFYLVNKKGQVVSDYSGTNTGKNPFDADKIMNDINALR
ncbi:SCO family protein [Heyndrickxia acidicola]|uniref:SCO family protein n=1 Tax=Heyndrickxia acidicola TaxID=209389 RepID=A0ABU6MDD8_9BACI|nr:SCO family protein [Heyndrickxia acidicola]MED1202449.1 SCO family protein [Heyndrickxia acidicola]